MLRKCLFGSITLACVLAVMGCGSDVDTSRKNDAPVNVGPTVDAKKGKKGKAVEMSLELPSTPSAPPAKK